MRAVVTLNAGSSSLKACLFRVDGGEPVLTRRAEVESIGHAPSFIARSPAGEVIAERRWENPATPFDDLLGHVLHWAETSLAGAALAGVGHRVVHGGRAHVRPERVTVPLLDELEALSALAPLHQPHNLAPIRILLEARPNLPQIACFDTAFHTTMPPLATRFALPRAYDEAGVRRYGFHGLSYEHIARRLSALDPALAAGRVIVAHLGAGASLCAMRGGRSMDTTMGFTALDGLMMGTRCGALDPGVVLHLQRQEGLGVEAVERMLYQQSGLLGVSGLSGDMRTLLASEDPRAAEAIDLYVYRIVREVGALTASLGGLDALVFTAGVGEHAAPIREKVCAGLAWLGAELDQAANAAHALEIGAPSARLRLLVIPTDEEAMIARHTLDLIGPT